MEKNFLKTLTILFPQGLWCMPVTVKFRYGHFNSDSVGGDKPAAMDASHAVVITTSHPQ